MLSMKNNTSGETTVRLSASKNVTRRRQTEIVTRELHWAYDTVADLRGVNVQKKKKT